jgi:hypothetical protein
VLATAMAMPMLMKRINNRLKTASISGIFNSKTMTLSRSLVRNSKILVLQVKEACVLLILKMILSTRKNKLI